MSEDNNPELEEETEEEIEREPINPLVLSYPEFTLGTIIDPAEVNQNNYDITNKVNEFIDEVEDALDIAEEGLFKSEQAILSAFDANQTADGAVVVAERAEGIADGAIIIANQANSKSDTAIFDSSTALDKAMQVEHDYNEIEPTLIQAVEDVNFAMNGGFDTRYVTRSEVNLENNIDIIYEIYTIVNADNGDGTFTYEDDELNQYIGSLNNGYQIFQLKKGDYTVGENRISAYINDTLHRSPASGGLIEIDSNNIGITAEGNGAEITIKYITISGSLGNGIIVGFVEPTQKYIGKVWIDTGGA